MAIEIRLVKDLPADASAVVIPACSDHLGSPEPPTEPTGLPPEANWAYLHARGFEGKVDQTAVVPGHNGTVLFLVGLGASAEVDANALRRAAAVVARAASRHDHLASYLLDAVTDPANKSAAAQAMAEGFLLGSYQFDRYKSKPEPGKLELVSVVSTGGKRVQAALDLGLQIAGGVNLARDLVNEPGGEMTPTQLAERVEAMAGACDIECTTWGHEEIRAERLGGLLGVNRGSVQPPRFVKLRYTPAGKPRGVLALVGKGITFDSGGLSLKTGTGMMTMKNDMGGAAAIIGAFAAIGAVAPRCEVRAYLPMTDNMIDGDATRPGDVLRMRNDKTVEVLNTDAEGRLVLADALSLASEDEPDAIVDLATLTGAVEAALGARIAGVMGRNASLVEQIEQASTVTAERVWPLPLPPEYRKHLDSDVADLRNIGKVASGGALTAGLFLQEFAAGDIPWAHLDIAGVAWSTDAEGELAKGGTGFGVRLLLELARRFTKPH